MPRPRQQQQHLMVNGTIPWPQQDPHQQQPQQQLISYDNDGGWVRGGIDCSAGVPPPSGNGGDGGGQQRFIGGHGSSDALVVATAAVATATTVIVGSILVVAMTATPLLPVVVIHRQIG